MNTAIERFTATGQLLGHVRYGTGPNAVLVLHDWLGDHSSYDALLPCLDGDTFTYVFADARGYGLSMALEGDCTVAELAGDCLRLADHLGWARFHVIGHSMTGMLTQRLAADAPSRVISAVAVCPVSAAGNRLPPEALAFFTRAISDDVALGRLFSFVTGGLCDAWVAGKVRQNRATVAPACRPKYLQMLVTADFVDDVRGLVTPFLVVVGDKDPGLDAAAMAQTFLAWHPNARLQVLPNCGHYPMQECPPYFATVIERFLRQQLG